ncbi:MAG: HEAT repeat domain-containing protein [Acidobacteria bacterium]|nr:HEAT repeat domain-containing protein [Acidobacteriota bacterium]
MQNSKLNFSKWTRLAAVASMLLVFAVLPFVSSRAQRRSKEQPPKVTGISSRKTASGDVVSLAADGALNGVQTWQDPNGSFHLILPGSGESPVKAAPGVKVRRVGNSLEIEVAARRGSNVTVQPRFNRLDLVVNGGIDPQSSAREESRELAQASAVEREESRAASAQQRPAPRTPRESSAMPKAAAFPDQLTSNQPLPSTPLSQSSTYTAPTSAQQSASTVSDTPANGVSVAQAPAQMQPPVPAPSSETAETDVGAESGWTFFYSGWWVTVLLIGVLISLVVWRRKDAQSGWEEYGPAKNVKVEAAPAALAETRASKPVDPSAINSVVGDRRVGDRRRSSRKGGRRSTDMKTPDPSELMEPHEQSLELRPASAPPPAALFGAYRVDQEVFKLVLGQPHRMDVLASRAPDDRRAMETSLLKAIRSNETDESGRRKARQALEDYGFLARQSATLLLAPDACERAAAARMLGEVGANSSLQFLLEALYDTEAIVRTQAVESIGALKLPSAIGALLDIAHRYPDMPTSIMSNALNACSIDFMGIFDDAPVAPQPALLMASADESRPSECTQLEPASVVYELPESSDDEALVDALAHLQSVDAEARATAAQTLALYRVGRAVTALKEMASSDVEPAVRAVAVASLGAIDHESVFSAVLVTLADEARDVRAAAARALSRLSFDRADAYVRVIETSDANELEAVALACIKTGMAGQALERLASDDRRQAYEAFSLLSLLARANQAQPILEVVERHTDINTCLVAIQLLGSSGHPDIASALRHLAVRETMPEQLRTALMEVVYKIDQMQTV